MEWLTCIQCGNKFEAVSKRGYKYCSPECKAEYHANVRRWKAKAEALEKQKKKERKKSIQDLATEAKQKGMTYGQLVALKYSEENRIQRKW